jgi:5'-nucleotidase
LPVPVQRLLLVALSVVAVAAGCGSDDGDGGGEDAAASTTAPPAAESTTTTTAPEPLRILVSNDDGYAAPGITQLVDALLELPDVEVVVVAPDGNRSGSGGQTTPGGTTGTDVTMTNGFAAVAVTGFPADAVAHALDVLGEQPDLVVSGVNEGQNLGPLVDISGTVGAARVAAQRGIPALAVSQGLGTPEPDYASGVAAAIAWIDEHRDDLAGATNGSVANINVPTCGNGELAVLVEVPAATDAAGRDVVTTDVDCALATTVTDPVDDVDAFNAGYPVLSLVGASPG